MAESSSSGSVSAARWLVGVIAGVVVCFTLASTVGEHLERAIAASANDISANAMPSVQMLTTARSNLRRLELELEQYQGAPADRRPELRDRIAATRRTIGAILTTYLSFPFFPNERALYKDIENAFAGLDRALADYLAGPAPGPPVTIDPAFDIADEAIERIVSFDAAQGQRLGLEIQRIHSESRTTVELLDLATILLAIGAVYLAVRQLRRTAQAQKTEREARERLAAELTVQNEALGQFAGRVAHDVLSPLSTAMLALELVQQASAQDPAAHRATERGIAAVARVHALVEGLLAFSRAGGQPEPGASTELAPVITDLVDGLSGRAKEHRIALIASAVPPGAVACSRGVLTSLLSNLIGNAIKHMGDAPVRRIELRTLDAGDRWRIEVEDTGPGIPLEHQERIFQPYVQLGRGAAGVGLGLATVDRLVRGHGGSLGVSSAPGRGSLFWFELPKAIATRPEPVRARGSLEPV